MGFDLFEEEGGDPWGGRELAGGWEQAQGEFLGFKTKAVVGGGGVC